MISLTFSYVNQEYDIHMKVDAEYREKITSGCWTLSSTIFLCMYLLEEFLRIFMWLIYSNTGAHILTFAYPSSD